MSLWFQNDVASPSRMMSLWFQNDVDVSPLAILIFLRERFFLTFTVRFFIKRGRLHGCSAVTPTCPVCAKAAVLRYHIAINRSGYGGAPWER
jgi:hypothetical protein